MAAVTNGDTGYVGHRRALPEAFTDFAADRWGWHVDPDLVRTTTDVSVAAVEVLRRVIEPGDQVVIMPPVYAPFWEYVAEAGGSATEVPLLAPEGPADPYDTTAGWRIDLDGLRAAFAEGARTVLLCNPHNPLGLVHPREDLVALARLAEEWGAVVVSDEIHAPLVHADAVFTPFLDSCPEAAAVGVALMSASKAWNLAGTKCALMIGASERARGWFDGLPGEVVERTGILGYTASVAAFREGAPGSRRSSPSSRRTGGPWPSAWATCCPASATDSRRPRTLRGSTCGRCRSATTRRRCCSTGRRSRCRTDATSDGRASGTSGSTSAARRRPSTRHSDAWRPLADGATARRRDHPPTRRDATTPTAGATGRDATTRCRDATALEPTTRTRTEAAGRTCPAPPVRTYSNRCHSGLFAYV